MVAVASDVAPRLSAELFVIPVSDEAADRYLVYAPLRQAAFVTNAVMVNFIADLREHRHDRELDRDGRLISWLRELGIVDGGEETQPVTHFTGPPEPTGLTLFLTTGCNLRCTYCYASAGDTPVRHMPIEVARRGIDFVIANAVQTNSGLIQLSFHGGGEPTLNWKVLTGAHAYASERAQQHGLTLSSFTATNGVLNHTQIDWITRHLDGASLSLDGGPQIQDKHRPLARGGGSSRRVLHTVERFDAVGFAYGIRVTVTRDQIAHLSSSVDFICRHARPQRIQVEPAYPMGRWRDAPSAATDEFIAAFREARACARAYGHELSYSAARVGLLTNHFCGVSQDSFALTADGNVSSCYEAFTEDGEQAQAFFYGRGEGDGFRFDLERLQRLRSLTVDHKPFCQGCFAKWHCAGDCHHNAMHEGGTFAGSDRCHITRALTRDQILERIAAQGGVAWRGDTSALRSGTDEC